MTDLEGIAKEMLKHGKSDTEILERLILEYQTFKNIEERLAQAMGEAVLQECKNTLAAVGHKHGNLLDALLRIPNAKVTMGEQGVGCRGYGDFFMHQQIAKLSQIAEEPFLSPTSLDDCGAVILADDFETNKEEPTYIFSKMEGMHSRLSDFPFLAGFHVTRAALRDLYVKGAIPISIMVDIHLGDDADVGRLLDFMAGISTIAEAMRVPITAGSTLRIGGDMVIGPRITGGIAAIGLAKRTFLRRDIQPTDIILMSEGAGGGTISTTALYAGEPEATLETINVQFLDLCRHLLTQRKDLLEEIHCMADVTNGGLRGDLYEIGSEAQLGATIYEKHAKKLVNPKVLELLERQNVDFMGVSLDALLIYCNETIQEQLIELGHELGVTLARIGEVTPKPTIQIVRASGKIDTMPKFRESAYTKVKQIIGEETPEARDLMEKRILDAVQEAKSKKAKVLKHLAEKRERQKKN